MRTSRFEAEEIIDLLNEAAEGVPVREICIRIGVSEATFYTWRTRYRGLAASGIRRLRELEQENSRLRRDLGNKNLEVDVLRAELSNSHINQPTSHS
jgi:putative transposase